LTFFGIQLEKKFFLTGKIFFSNWLGILWGCRVGIESTSIFQSKKGSGEVTTTQMTERAGMLNGIPALFYADVRLRACATLFYSTASFVTVPVLHL
jgi:hypothetical protein